MPNHTIKCSECKDTEHFAHRTPALTENHLIKVAHEMNWRTVRHLGRLFLFCSPECESSFLRKHQT